MRTECVRVITGQTFIIAECITNASASALGTHLTAVCTAMSAWPCTLILKRPRVDRERGFYTKKIEIFALGGHSFINGLSVDE